MRLRFPGFLLLSTVVLAGCGGGGATAPLPSNGPTPGPTIASVSGRVVDDSTGAPLAGVNVGLAPWIADATPLPEGTTAPDGTFAFSAQPGHYLLVVGSNSAADTTRATIHDNVTLVAGTNALQAPVLPPWPTVTPPAWELNGSYRLQTIDAATELPCFTAYNAQRSAHGLPSVVFDEWLKENTRDAVAWHTGGQYDPSKQTNASHALTISNAGSVGGTDCSHLASEVDLQRAESANPHNLWFSGKFIMWTAPGTASPQGFGISELPLDPREQIDGSGYVWP